MELEITPRHQEQYERDGYTIVRGGFSADECDRFVAYMLDLHAGRFSVEGYPPRQPDDWSRLISRSLHHPAGLAWMLDPRLRGGAGRYGTMGIGKALTRSVRARLAGNGAAGSAKIAANKEV